MISVQEALALVRYTKDEERAIAKMEAAVDAELVKFEGTPVRLTLSEDLSPKIVAAIQRKYETGQWRVITNLKERELTFVPMFLPAVLPPVGAQPRANKLPPAVMVTVEVPVIGKRLLVRMPTRGRPEQALEVLAKYRAMAGMPITIEVVIDEDDDTMRAPEVLQRLVSLGCVITVGAHKSKVEAVNAGRVREWDVLLLASDDMVPVVDDYAKRALAAMEKRFPYLDGVIYFDDGYQHENCCTLPIMGRRLYDQFGYVYHPSYKSLFCDQEQTEMLRAINRIAYVDEEIIQHKHWVVGAKKDALYERNDALWEADKAVYERRKKLGCVVPPLRLSVLICAIPSRATQLHRLLDHLWQQILTLSAPYGVEIIVDDREGVSIGEKRQALLERACCKFIAFVDDDDWVSGDYIARIVHALESDPEADCASLSGIMTTAGAAPEPFYNSLRYSEWFSKDGVHYRTPTHLSPVRRELALQAGFVSKSHGEDFEYSRALRPLLKREASTGDAPLYYYFYMPGKPAREGQ